MADPERLEEPNDLGMRLVATNLRLELVSRHVILEVHSILLPTFLVTVGLALRVIVFRVTVF